MRAPAALPLLLVIALVACGQDVVTPPCADHDATTPGDAADAGLALDAAAPGDAADAAPGLDATPARDAGEGPDAMPGRDAGEGRCPGSFCFTLVATSTRVNVREAVTLTPTLDNPGAVPLTFSVRPAEVVTERRPGRPALVLSELDFSFTVDAATGVATVRVNDVPPWFIATTFHLRVYATGAGSTAYAEIAVHVRGNTAYSANYSDVSRVYAVASDGRPARARQPGLMQGELITQLARAPSALLMSRDGALVVHDTGASPPRLMRFELTGHDQQLSTFEYRDAQNEPYLDLDPAYAYALAELPDGAIAVADYEFSRSTSSRIVMFEADGRYRTTWPATDPLAVWSSIAVHSSGDLLVTRLDGMGRVERIDPATGLRREFFAEALPGQARSVLGLADGTVYVGGTGFVVRISGAARSVVGMLPTSSNSWRMLAPWADGQILASTDERTDSAMPVRIEARQYVAPLRLPMVGNVTSSLRGLAYLE